MPTFPVLERFAYLNAGTFGPLAQETVDAVASHVARELESGRGGAPYFEALIALRGRVRAAIAELLDVDASRLALTSSTSSGCQIVLAGLGLRPDDEIVTTDEEHFGLLGPIAASGARVRVAATRARPPEEALDAILAEVGPRTRLVALSHVSWMTGHILPIEAVKEATAVPILADGAQSAGAIPVDVGKADFYTVSGQKWLCGPDATGALYVADPERLRVALPSYFSRTEHGPDGAFEPVDGSSRFDAGTIPMPSLAGLEVALGARRIRDTRTGAAPRAAAASSSWRATTSSRRPIRPPSSRFARAVMQPRRRPRSTTPESSSVTSRARAGCAPRAAGGRRTTTSIVSSTRSPRRVHPRPELERLPRADGSARTACVPPGGDRACDARRSGCALPSGAPAVGSAAARRVERNDDVRRENAAEPRACWSVADRCPRRALSLGVHGPGECRPRQLAS